jgi:hypothetical protein
VGWGAHAPAIKQRRPNASNDSPERVPPNGVDSGRESCNLCRTVFFVFNAFNGYVSFSPRAPQPAYFSYWRYPIMATKVRCS